MSNPTTVILGEMLQLLDQAIDTADLAVKAADEASAPRQPAYPEPVRLVKVAADRSRSAAALLMKTGSFRDHSESSLASLIENAGPSDLLDIMEKLASSAVFPFDIDPSMKTGDLVEKSANGRKPATSQSRNDTDLWVECCEEAGMKIG